MSHEEKIAKFINHAVRLPKKTDNHFLSFANLISIRQYEILYEKILNLVPDGSTILDWGCGNGHCSYFLNYFGYNVVAYSLDDQPAIIEQKDKFKFIKGIKNEPIKLPIKDNEFAAVVGVGVLEHVRETGGDEISSLKEINRITQIRGIFVCAHLPNRWSWIEFVVNFFRLNKFTHRHQYNKSEIINLWESAGWDIKSIDRYNWLPRNIFRNKLRFMANNKTVANIYDIIEVFFKFLLFPFQQNFIIISQKPNSTRSK